MWKSLYRTAEDIENFRQTCVKRFIDNFGVKPADVLNIPEYSQSPNAMTCKFANQSRHGRLLATCGGNAGSDHKELHLFDSAEVGVRDLRSVKLATSGVDRDLTWTHDDRAIAVPTYDRCRSYGAILDVETFAILAKLPNRSVKQLKRIRFCPLNPTVALCVDWEGCISLHDLRACSPLVNWYHADDDRPNKPSQTTVEPIFTQYACHQGSVADAALFDHFAITAGSSDGCVKFWDLRHLSRKTTTQVGSKRHRSYLALADPVVSMHHVTRAGRATGIVNIDISPCETILAVHTVGSRIAIHDLSNVLLGLGSASGVEKSFCELPERVYTPELKSELLRRDRECRSAVDEALRTPHMTTVTPPRSQVRFQKNCTSVTTISPDRSHLTGEVYMPDMQLIGHNCSGYYSTASFSRCGNFLAVNSDDHRMYMWQIDHKLLRAGSKSIDPCSVLASDTFETCFAWGGDGASPSNNIIAAVSAAGALRTWSTGVGEDTLYKAQAYADYIASDHVMHAIEEAVATSSILSPDAAADIYWSIASPIRRRQRPRPNPLGQPERTSLIQAQLPLTPLDVKPPTVMEEPPTVPRQLFRSKSSPTTAASEASFT